MMIHNKNRVKLANQDAKTRRKPDSTSEIYLLFHASGAIGLLLCKRSRPYIHPTVAVLCTRVKNLNQGDGKNLLRLMKYLLRTHKLCPQLKSERIFCLKYDVDAAVAVHQDFKSHTGATLTMVKGAIISMSRKKKLNAKISTEYELVVAGDAPV